MPFSMGAQGSHDDTSHQGSAKKGIASGVASLDAASKVVQDPASKGLASGVASLNASSKVVEDPASKGLASGVASLNASSKVVEEPASKGLASGIASLDASSKVVEEPASKAQASGIASLDASSRVPIAQLALAVPKTGSFTPDNTANRAVAHGLGRTPSLVLFYSAITAVTGGHGNPTTSFRYDGGVNNAAHTANDATNFYCSNSYENYGTTGTVYWFAI